MKVKELRKLLENVSENREIIIKTSLGDYELQDWSEKENFYSCDGYKVKAFYLAIED